MPTSSTSNPWPRLNSVRAVSWLTPARKAFDRFPKDVRDVCSDALTIAAEGGKSDIAKPLKGFGPGVYEIALGMHGNAWRVVYAVRIGEDLWVLHAFQKKSNQGKKTPKHEIDLIEQRLRWLKDMLR
jgi:phage-related protein